MQQLHLNFKDIFRAPRFGLSLQKIWIQYVGLLSGYLVYLVFSYVSFFSAELQPGAVWMRYGLLPCLFTTGETYSWYTWLLYSVGAVFLVVSLLIAQTAGARSVYIQAKGNDFYIWREAYKFALNKMWSVLLTPVSLILLLALMALGSILISFLGKIPFIGEISIGLTTVVWFVSSLLMFYIFIVSIISLLLAPQIIATSEEDSFEAIFQAFSISWKQPWRLVIYESLTIFLSLFSLAMFAFFVKNAILLMNVLLGTFMGTDFINLSNNGQGYVQSCLLMAQNILHSIFHGLTPLLYFQHEFILIPSSDLSTSVVIASYLYAASLLFIAGWVISYGLSTFASGNTLLYLAIRKIKDDVNILDRTDSEEIVNESVQDKNKDPGSDSAEQKSPAS